MKTAKNRFSMLLAGALSVALLVTSALAAWPVYGGNDNHNAVVTSAPTSASPSVTKIGLLNSGSGWSGVDTVPVMETVDGITYAYVLYDGHSAGGRLAKIDCSSGTTLWDVQLSTASGFQLSTPVLNGSYVYVATNSGTICRVDKSIGAKTDLVSVTGQINTPLVVYGDYLYFGTWIGNGDIDGSTLPGRYYQLNLTDTSDLQSVLSMYKGFYWAGAVKSGSHIYFGGDGGYIYYRPAGAGFGSAASTSAEISAYCVTLATVNGNAPGDVRSTVMLNDGKLYFTSKGAASNGNLYCYTADAATGKPTYAWGAVLGGTCTSTPVITAKGRIYVGYYSGFSAGGIQKVVAPSNTGEGAVGSVYTLKVDNIAFNKPVQCTPVVYTVGNTDYIYFNTNSSDGAGYCISILNTTPAGTAASKVWSTSGDTYALGGMAIENGYAVFGNDYNHLYVVK